LREKAFWVFLLILLLNVVVIQSMNPNLRINPVQAPSIPNLCVDPPETVDPLLVVGQEFTVSLNISDLEDPNHGLYGWEARITFNPEAVNCTSRTEIVEGPFLIDWFGYGYTTFQRSIDYRAGYVLVAGSSKPPYEGGGAIGDGILAYINFTVIANERATLLQFANVGGEGGTYLRSAVGGVLVPLEPLTTQDGIFDNRSGPNTPPVADFSVLPLQATKRGEVSFDASASYDPDAWIISYQWNCGDGTSEIYLRERLRDINLTVTSIHAYSLNGTYPVTLTVEDTDGATATKSSQVTVLFDIAVTNVESPFIAVMPGTIVTINVTVENYGNFNEAFNLTASYNETAIGTQEIWSLAPQTQEAITFIWDTTGVDFGQYTLKANASIVEGEVNVDNNEHIDSFLTIAESNVINYPVLVGGVKFNVVVESTSSISAFNFNRVEKRTSFNATGESGTGGFCNVTIPMNLLNASSPYAWIVELNDVPISYTSTSNGTHYFICFDYTHGDIQSAVNIIGETVATPPMALFTASRTTALAGESITFDASTSDDLDGNIESWDWIFGDGGVGTGEIVQHAFATNGTYTVTLTVKDDEHLANSTQVTIIVIDYPIAGFSYLPSEPLVDQTINFDAAASDPVGGTITSYTWKFGDGQTGTGRTTTHSYLTTGTFTVNLTVTDSEGLTNSTTKTVTVKIHDIAITSLTATPSTVRIDGIVTIQLTAENNGNFTESFTITAYYHDTTDVAIETKSITNLASGYSQLLTILWNTANTPPDTYTIKAETSAIPGETRTEDNTLTDVIVTLQKKTSSLTVDASSATVTLGSSTTISGTLTPTLQGKTITLQYRLEGQSWNTLSTMTTDAQSNYQFPWTPTSTGTYEIQATWQGDANTEACQSEPQSITVKEAEAQGIPMEYVAVTLALAIILIVVVIYLVRIRKR